jgi:hypothetical protein
MLGGEVAEWVRSAGERPLDVPPRFSVVAIEEHPPLVLQGVRRFVGAPAPARCKAPTWMPATHASIDNALRKCNSFLQCLREEIDDYMGTVGANAHMRQLVGPHLCVSIGSVCC